MAEDATRSHLPERGAHLTPETIEAAVQRAFDRRSLGEIGGQALAGTVDDLVKAAMTPALSQALAPLREELNRLHAGVEEAKATAAETRVEVETRMRSAETAVAAIGADLALNSLKTADTAALIQTMVDDQRAQREKREQQEAAERAKQEDREAAALRVATDRAERLEWLVKWGVGFIVSLVTGGVVIELETWVQRQGSLTPQIGIGLAGAGVVIVVVIALWVRVGFGLRPSPHPAPHPHPPHPLRGGPTP